MGGEVRQIAESRGIKVQRVGALELVTAKDAAAVLEVLRQRGLRVVGIEGFRQHGTEAFVPDLSFTMDVSGLDPEESLAESTLFLEEATDPDLLFEITVSHGQGA